MQRALRIAGSFVIVLVAYWAYALVAVPLIEPPADPRRYPEGTQPVSEAERAAAQGRIEAGIAELEGVFPPGAWELSSPKILQSDQIKLLMQDYRNLGGGRVEIRPCTIIFTPDGPADDETQRKRRAVILEAPEGALLKFDRPLNLRQMKIGRLEGGQLRGRITIRSRGSLPGPADDLLIVTRDVELTEQNIITPHAVDFRYGPHYGRGSQMRIQLPSGDQAPGGNRGQPSIAGIDSFELRRIERLHLELGEVTLGPDKRPVALGVRPDATAQPPRSVADAPGQATAPGKPSTEPASPLPVEITCQGRFRFDAIQKVATFEDQVDVLRLHPTGPSDQLNCEKLSVFFADPAQPTPDGPGDAHGAAKKQPAGSLNLRPQRIEAQGVPVVVHAPSENVHARGERLEYDLQTGRIVLDGTQEVMLQREPNEIHARSLQYQPGEPGQLGQTLAQGPGWLRGQMDRRPQQQLEARWNDRLQVRPHEGNQVISLSGGAGVKFRGIDQLDAGEIHLWLLPSQPQHPDDKSSLRPDRMLARNDVRISSPGLSGTVDQLEVWFEPAASGESGRGTGEGGSGRADGGIKSPIPNPQSPIPNPQSPIPNPQSPIPNPKSQIPNAQPNSPPAARQQHFQIAARLLRARMSLQKDGRAVPSELTLEDGVEFVETQTKLPDERPVLVRGDRLHLLDADKPYAAVTVNGRPAHFQGRGLVLSGPNINLNRGTNRLWIDAAGRMDLVMDRDLEGRPLRSPGLLQICWQKDMTFDGRTARFEEAVTATAPHQYLQTETLEVQFRQPIDFSGDQIQQQPAVERLVCRGGVFMESSSFDEKDPTKQISHERMQVPDLEINRTSGALTAGGPGWLSSVRPRSDDPLSARTGGLPRAAAGNHQSSIINHQSSIQHYQLIGLHVRFQGSITGNVLKPRQEMTFHDGVQAAYAPVDSWAATLDVNDPESLGDEGVVMQCDRLSVHEMDEGPGSRGQGAAASSSIINHQSSIELVADGNTKVDGNAFNARCIRMTYAKSKDLLILEGDGRSDAQLFTQQQVGGPTKEFTARKIFYSPKTGRFYADGARSLQWDQLPTGDPAKR